MKWRNHAFLAGVTELAAAIVPQPRIYLHFGAEFDIARLFDREPLSLVCGQDWDDGMGGTPNPDGFVPELLFGSVSGIPVMAAQHCRSCADGGGVQPIIFPDALAYRLGARDFIYLDAGISLEGELKAGKWAMLTDFISNYGFSPLDGMHSFMPIPYPNLGETLSQYLNSEIINALGENEPIPLLCTCCGVPGFQQPTPATADRARNEGAAIMVGDLVLHLPFACALGCRSAALTLAVSQMLPGYYPAVARDDFTETCKYCSRQLMRALKIAIPEIAGN